MVPLNMHGAKYGLARAINNLVITARNSLRTYCPTYFAMLWIEATHPPTTPLPSNFYKCHNQSQKKKKAGEIKSVVHISLAGLNACRRVLPTTRRGCVQRRHFFFFY